VQFRIGSIPVRIRPVFLVLMLVLSALLERGDLIVVRAAIILVSVLVHELGHALVGRLFGLQPQIELHGMGGATSWTTARDIGDWRSLVISLAGPMAGFVIAALAFSAGKLGFHPRHELAAFALEQAFLINLVWGVFNLAPMLPLDGGNVLRSALNIVTKGRGEKPSRVISMLVGIGFLVVAFRMRQLWLGALAGFFTWSNFQAYRQPDIRSADAPLAQAIEKAYLALEHHDGSEAIALLRPVLVPQASEELRAVGLRLFCYALLIEGEWSELLPTLQKNAALIGPEEMARYAATARELERVDEADRITKLVTQLTPLLPRPANDFG
jgi:stage IV sporulation protein FB